MNQRKHLLVIPTLFVFGLFLYSCSSPKSTVKTPTAPTVQRVPAKFDFTPPSRSQMASTDITIAIVKPTYIDKNAEYFVPPFDEMATSMGNDFEELLTAKGFTVRGPFGSRDEMTYNDKINSSFVLEISIDLQPHYNRSKTTITHKPSFSELLVDKNAPTTYTYKISGEVTFAGNLVINARAPRYGELIWKKNIALQASSFNYNGILTWNGIPSMAEELNQDNQVYNTVSTELEKYYLKALALAWQQIDPEEMKTVADQAKKSDKKN